MSRVKDLLQLRELFQSGLLNEDEYVTARRKLVGHKVRRVRHGDGPNDLPVLFALAAMTIVGTTAAIYFVTVAR